MRAQKSFHFCCFIVSFMALLKNVFPICLLCSLSPPPSKKIAAENSRCCLRAFFLFVWKALSICYQRLISPQKKTLLSWNNGRNHKLINYLFWWKAFFSRARWRICNAPIAPFSACKANGGLMNFFPFERDLFVLIEARARVVNMSGIN